MPAVPELVSANAILLALAVTAATFLIQQLLTSLTRTTTPLPPGPRALPVVGHLHLLGPIIHQSFTAIASKYGPLIYIKLGSVPCIVASSPDLARDLLKTNETKFLVRQTGAAVLRLTYDASFAFAPYDGYWKFIKRLSQNELLNPRTLGQFEPIRAQEICHFLGTVNGKSQTGERVNLTEELLKLSNNIISRMMLGIRCSDKDGQGEACRSAIREVTEIFGTFNVSDFIWFCKNVDIQGFRKRFEDVHRRFDGVLEDIIEAREKSREENRKRAGGIKEEEEEIKDFLDMMLDVHEDPNSEMKFTRNHIKGLVLNA